MIGPQPVCFACRHFDPETDTCPAFPEAIPDSIWIEGDPHTSPVDGDDGIRFELAPGAEPPPALPPPADDDADDAAAAPDNGKS